MLIHAEKRSLEPTEVPLSDGWMDALTKKTDKIKAVKIQNHCDEKAIKRC